MSMKGAHGHPNSEAHLQNCKTYQRTLDQQAFDRQRVEEDLAMDEIERREYTKPSVFIGSMMLPKPTERSRHYWSAIEQEVWATLTSKGADFGFEDNPAESEQDRLILEAKQLSSFHVEGSDTEGADLDERGVWEAMESDDELRAELQEILGKFLFSCILKALTVGFLVSAENGRTLDDLIAHELGERTDKNPSAEWFPYQSKTVSTLYLHESAKLLINNV
jgi:hypothetical protein